MLKELNNDCIAWICYKYRFMCLLLYSLRHCYALFQNSCIKCAIPFLLKLAKTQKPTYLLQYTRKLYQSPSCTKWLKWHNKSADVFCHSVRLSCHKGWEWISIVVSSEIQKCAIISSNIKDNAMNSKKIHVNTSIGPSPIKYFIYINKILTVAIKFKKLIQKYLYKFWPQISSQIYYFIRNTAI